VSNYW